VQDLQRLCERQLQAGLTADNVLHMLSVAELYDSVNLRSGVLAYIAQNVTALVETLEQCQDVLCTMAGVNRTTALPDAPG
jgi:hypothetical protein